MTLEFLCCTKTLGDVKKADNIVWSNYRVPTKRLVSLLQQVAAGSAGQVLPSSTEHVS